MNIPRHFMNNFFPSPRPAAQSPLRGDLVPLNKTHPHHLPARQPEIHERDVAGSFGAMLNQALSTVNSQQVHADKLAQKMVYDPKSVEPHTLMIAAEKARISLSLTKNIVDTTVKSYRELINMR